MKSISIAVNSCHHCGGALFYDALREQHRCLLCGRQPEGTLPAPRRRAIGQQGARRPTKPYKGRSK